MTSRNRQDVYTSSTSRASRRESTTVSASSASRSGRPSVTTPSRVGSVVIHASPVTTPACDVSTLAGYEAVFEYEAEGLDNRYSCPVCLAVLRQPVQTKCGHRFCNSCFRGSIARQRQARCPVDKTVLSNINRDVFNDLAMEREVLSLLVRCNNCSIGCAWRGELRLLEEHVGRCLEASVPCTNAGCSSVYKRGEHDAHQRECAKRIQSCTHCGSDMMASEMAKHQLLVCPRFPVTCGQCSEPGIVREDILAHCNPKTGTCPMSVVECEFTSVGCSFQDLRKNLVSHMESPLSVSHHLSLLRTALFRIERQQPSYHFNQQQQQSTNLRHQMIHGATLRRLFDDAEAHSLQLDGGLLGNPRESTPRDGSLLWKISLILGASQGLPGPLPSHRSYRSPPFYTAYFGYKVHVVLEVPANGGLHDVIELNHRRECEAPLDNDVIASSNDAAPSVNGELEPYCSIFIRLEPGNFDEAIRFPLDGSLNVTLINQASNPDDRIDLKASVVFHDLHRVFPVPVAVCHSVPGDSAADGGAESLLTSVSSSASTSTSGNLRGRLRLISLRNLLNGPFIRNGEVFVQVHVSHVLPFPISISASGS